MRSTCVLVVMILSTLAGAPRAFAQDHIAGQQVLDAAVQQQVRAADRDRDTVRQFLERGDVKAVAGRYGIDLRRAETAVATTNAEELASIATQARAADESLAGGASTVTISTTTIIIGLLVLILLIVALR